MPVVTITHAEILDALATAATGDGPAEARTATELARETGINVERVRLALHEYRRQGRLGVHHVSRVGLDGRPQRLPAYTITPLPRSTVRKSARRHG